MYLLIYASFNNAVSNLHYFVAW